MNNDKKIYLYSGLSIVGAIIAYIIITRKKPLLNDASEGSEDKDPETNISVSTTGEVLEQVQVVIPKSLSDILNKTTAQSTALLINKPIYTKLDNVKVRNSNYVNNGIIDNIMSTISSSGFLLGNVIQIVEDKGKLKNNEGRVYRWFKIKPAQITLDEMNRNKSFLTHVFLPNSTGREIYVREDTVKLEKN